MHYVIGDVHGSFDELMKLIGIIESRDAEAQFIFTGDWPDRGKDVYKTLQWMVEHITPDGKYQSVRGNHDQLCIDWFRDAYEPYIKNADDNPWVGTIYDFSDVVRDEFHNDYEAVKRVIDTMSIMEFNKRIDITTNAGKTVRFRIMHGWHDTMLSNVDNRRNNLDSRRHFNGNLLNNGEIYVHGHTPTIHGEYNDMSDDDRKGLICYRKDCINVDGGCCFFPYYSEYACMLCAICLETLEEIYPYSIEERFDMGKDITCGKAVLQAQYANAPEPRYRREILEKYYT